MPRRRVQQETEQSFFDQPNPLDEPPPPKAPADYLALRDDAKEALDAGHVDEAVMILVMCGWHWPPIARACGLKTWQEARTVFNRRMGQERRMQRSIRQDVELRKLDRLERRLQPQADQGNVEAIKTILQISESRRKILADNEPERVAPPAIPTYEELARKMEAMEAAGAVPLGSANRYRSQLAQHGLTAPRLPAPESQDGTGEEDVPEDALDATEVEVTLDE